MDEVGAKERLGVGGGRGDCSHNGLYEGRINKRKKEDIVLSTQKKIKKNHCYEKISKQDSY